MEKCCDFMEKCCKKLKKNTKKLYTFFIDSNTVSHYDRSMKQGCRNPSKYAK